MTTNITSDAMDWEMEQASHNHPPHPDLEDTIMWADGTTCYRYELPDMSHKSDDYEAIPC